MCVVTLICKLSLVLDGPGDFSPDLLERGEESHHSYQIHSSAAEL